MSESPLRKEIHEWIKNDVPVTVRMTLLPASVDKLEKRIIPLLADEVLKRAAADATFCRFVLEGMVKGEAMWQNAEGTWFREKVSQ